jgi:hypothetical protein
MAGAAVTREDFTPLLTPELRKIYVQTGMERPMEHPMLVNTENMPGNPITDRAFSSLGVMPEMPEGGRFTLDAPIQGSTVTYTAAIYGLGFEVTRSGWEDDMYGFIRQMPAALARSSRHRIEVDAHAPLNRAFSSSYTGLDGLQLCHTAHTRLDGGTTQGNRSSPDVGLSATGIQAARLQFENMVDDRGMPRMMIPQKLVITPTNIDTAREILGSAGRAYTANVEINSLQQDDLSIIVDHYITTATYWFLMAANGQHDVNFFMRSAPSFDSFMDPWTGNAIFTVWQRHTSGFGAWQGVWGSTG